MKKTDVSRFFKSIGQGLSKHSPEILTGLGIAGMITTTVLAVKATPKALDLIETEKRERYVEEKGSIDVDPYFLDYHKPLPSKLDYIKVAWKPYIPAALTGVFSIACLIGASSVHVRRNAAIATAYKLSETALTEYREKVIETIGEKKEKDVRDKVAKGRVENNPVSKNEVIITKKGETLCMDYLSKRYFKSDIHQIKRAINELNRQMLNDMYVSLNDLYDELGLDHIPLGYELGWKIDDGYIDLDLSSQIADDGTPCIVVGYTVAPRRDYSKLM